MLGYYLINTTGDYGSAEEATLGHIWLAWDADCKNTNKGITSFAKSFNDPSADLRTDLHDCTSPVLESSCNDVSKRSWIAKQRLKIFWICWIAACTCYYTWKQIKPLLYVEIILTNRRSKLIFSTWGDMLSWHFIVFTNFIRKVTNESMTRLGWTHGIRKSLSWWEMET